MSTTAPGSTVMEELIPVYITIDDMSFCRYVVRKGVAFSYVATSNECMHRVL